MTSNPSVYLSNEFRKGGSNPLAMNSLEISLNLGGKGKSLARLELLGYRVPPFFILPEETLSHFFSKELHEAETFHFHKGPTGKKSGRSPHPFFKTVPPPLQKKVKDLLCHFSPSCFISLRSSAVCEDSGSHSYAGMFETSLFLNPQKPEEIFSALLHAMESLFSERVLEYRKNQGDEHPLKMALVFQKMVDSKVSGVAYSINSVESNPEEIIINSVFGQGEGLVSGELTGDTFFYNRVDQSIRKKIAKKNHQMKQRKDGTPGLIKTPIEPSKQPLPSLEEPQVREIVAQVQKIEIDYHRPMDVEWAIDQDKVYILQARPITSIHNFPFGRKLLWDNSNIVESYSDITLPLTFSFASKAYKVVYTQFGRMIGVPREVHDENDRFMDNYLAIFKGRIYYNLGVWYGSMAYLPGFGFTKVAMENMMGVRESFDFPSPKAPENWFEKYFVELPKLLTMIGKIIFHFLNFNKLYKSFTQNFSHFYKTYLYFPFKEQTPEKLMDIYFELVWKVQWKWQAPIVADCMAMVFYGVLKKLVKGWCYESEGLANDLLAGTGDIESKEPIEELIRAGAMIRQNPELKKGVEKLTPENLYREILINPVLTPLKSWVKNYLHKYGMRTPNELKLEEITYQENPTFLMHILKSYSQMDFDLDQMKIREEKMRAQAEKRVFKALKGKTIFYGLIGKKRIFDWVLKNARGGVRNRENLRFARTKMYGIIRQLFVGMGHALQERKILDHPRDIFYLKVDELVEFMDGRAVTTDLKGTVLLRKGEYKKFESENPDDRFFTYGIPYHCNPMKYRKQGLSIPKEIAKNQLSGIGVCPGVVRGEICLVRDPREQVSLQGKIMVAEKTDPGWVPLFPLAKGLLIQKGSVLSHSAIVAREMGIPAIVGIEDLFERLKEGQWVEFDGSTGIVTLLDPKEKIETPKKPPKQTNQNSSGKPKKRK